MGQWPVSSQVSHTMLLVALYGDSVPLLSTCMYIAFPYTVVAGDNPAACLLHAAAHPTTAGTTMATQSAIHKMMLRSFLFVGKGSSLKG